MSGFKKAERKQSKLRLMISGTSGSGKTYSSLILGKKLADLCGGRLAVVDTERGSASLYATKFDFDVIEMGSNFSPEAYVSLLKAAADAKEYAVVILDSISPEWEGVGGCLDIHNKMGGRFQDWAKITPRHNAFIQAMLTSPLHVIATVRSKTDYSVDDNTKKITKQGLAPKQRDGMDYEFTTVFDLNQHHLASVSKDRTSLFDGQEHVITEDTAEKLYKFLLEGSESTTTPVVVYPLEQELQDLGVELDIPESQLEAGVKKYGLEEALNKLRAMKNDKS